jgi:hypothetical protein
VAGEGEEVEWLPASEAIGRVSSIMDWGDARRAICKRAHAGILKARAAHFVEDGRRQNDVEVPPEFWSAEGENALIQNWNAGDFETWIDGVVELKAFGVSFDRAGIEKIAPRKVRAPEPAVARAGDKIFIGHGRDQTWRALKDFIEGTLKLPYEEFNRVPVAGVSTVDRLKQMLESAAFAFLVFTAEDEGPGGNLQPRMNVVHELGLFQGRLGFERAIVLLEEGCEEFSNIAGLNQLRFPKGKIHATFEEIRGVLRRERLLPQRQE